MSIVKLTTDNFEQEVINSDKPVLVDLYADWCGPCQMLSPTIEEIAISQSNIKVCKINVDEQTPLAIKYGVSTIPTLLVFKNGQVVNKSVGVIPKEKILSLLD